MDIIKVDATVSTNTLAREMFKENMVMFPTCFVAKQQLKGRGQRGTSWLAKPGQNLTFSLLFPQPQVSVEQQFLLSATVSIAIVESLEKFNVPKLKVKWPNDILSGNYKLGGILIENVISEGKLAATIIGIGLNVNQTEFEFPAAGSLKLVTGQHFCLEELLELLTESIKKRMEGISDLDPSEIFADYREKLFRLGKASTFETPDKSLFNGIIVDVSQQGKLVVKIDETTHKEYDLKEIKLLY